MTGGGEKGTAPDVVADLDLGALRFGQPLGNVGAHDAILQLHIDPQRLAREKRQEGLADGLQHTAAHVGTCPHVTLILHTEVHGDAAAVLVVHLSLLLGCESRA